MERKSLKKFLLSFGMRDALANFVSMEADFTNTDQTACSKEESISMDTMKKIIIVYFILLTTGAAIAASPRPITCGSTLSGHRTYTLPADLDCSTATAPITVKDRAVLNLNNHVYGGQIVLDGRRAQLREGTIECILAGTDGEFIDDERCVRVEGAGGHTVEDVLIRYLETDGFGVGIWVLSDNNVLTNNTLFHTPTAGVLILGNDNVLQGNRAINIDGFGFWIDGGQENKLIGNYATTHRVGYFLTDASNNLFAQNVHAGVADEQSVTDAGFGIGEGSGNRLTTNVVTNEDYGIIMGTLSGPNRIDNNIAVGNRVVDLTDFNGNCDVNTWENNIFETSSPTCIGGNSSSVVVMDITLEKNSAFVRDTRLRLARRFR